MRSFSYHLLPSASVWRQRGESSLRLQALARRDMTWQDFRIAFRTLFRARGLAVGAIATLALAIGMTTSVFSILNAVLLRPLPYRDAERLAVIWSVFSKNGRGAGLFRRFRRLASREQDA